MAYEFLYQQNTLKVHRNPALEFGHRVKTLNYYLNISIWNIVFLCQASRSLVIDNQYRDTEFISDVISQGIILHSRLGKHVWNKDKLDFRWIISWEHLSCHPALIPKFIIVEIFKITLHQGRPSSIYLKVKYIWTNQRKESLVCVLIINPELICLWTLQIYWDIVMSLINQLCSYIFNVALPKHFYSACRLTIIHKY